MSNEELKLSLLHAHARDRRLTFISYSLVIIIAVLVIIFLGRFLLGMIGGEDNLYPKLALGAVLTGYVIYAVFRLVKISNRHKEIDEFMLNIQSGSRATNIVEYKEYRIIIPLGKITYKMCPVEFHKFSLDSNPAKYYAIPVHPAYAPDLKKLLSGADLDMINEQLEDLYTEKGLEYEYDDTPVKSPEEFREYIKAELGETVKEIEDNRRKSLKLTRLSMAVAIPVVVIFLGYMFYTAFTNTEGNIDMSKIYIPMLILFGAFYLVYFLFLKPKAAKAYPGMAPGEVANSPAHDFKTKVMDKIVKFVSPDSQYIMHGHIGYEELMESGMFSPSNYKLYGNDLIIGKYKGVPFQFCNLTIEIQKKLQKENESPEYAFSGQFFVARFNKSFSSPVRILPRKSAKNILTGDTVSGMVISSGEKVQLEDPEFMDMFTVYGDDQIEARYILTPSLMERIKELAKRTEGKYILTFYNNKVTLAHSGKDNFEFNQKKSITDGDYQVLVDFYKDLADQFGIIDDLKLNIKIWN